MTSQPTNSVNPQFSNNSAQQILQGNNSQGSYQQDQPMNSFVPQPSAPHGKPKGKGVALTLVLLLVLVLTGIGGGVLYYQNLDTNNTNNTVLGAFDSNAYHTVFMNNGNVYFGKVLVKNSDVIVLEDTHFLQISQPQAQQQQQQAVLNEEGQEVIQPQTQQQVQPEISIVKRTNTLHAPDGTVEINMTNVSFIEKLTPESQVIEAINKLKEEELNKAQ